jgi:hypothetical protein
VRTAKASGRFRDRPLGRSVAQGLSWLFNPLVYCTLYFGGLVARRPAWWMSIFGLWALLVAAPAALLVIGQRWGLWTDWDVSRLAERRRYMPWVWALSATAVAVSWGASWPEVLRFSAAAICLWLTLSVLVGFWWKISLHVGGTVGILGLVWVVWGPPLVWAVAWPPVAVAWARIQLKRHTWGQVVAGAVAGAISVLAVRYGFAQAMWNVR